MEESEKDKELSIGKLKMNRRSGSVLSAAP
jgi:hypothetical protein